MSSVVMKSNLFNVLLQYSFHPCRDDFKSASIANIQPAINPVASEFETQMRILSIKKSRHDEVLHYKNTKDPIMKIIVPDLCLSQYRLEV